MHCCSVFRVFRDKKKRPYCWRFLYRKFLAFLQASLVRSVRPRPLLKHKAFLAVAEIHSDFKTKTDILIGRLSPHIKLQYIYLFKIIKSFLVRGLGA